MIYYSLVGIHIRRLLLVKVQDVCLNMAIDEAVFRARIKSLALNTFIFIVSSLQPFLLGCPIVISLTIECIIDNLSSLIFSRY